MSIEHSNSASATFAAKSKLAVRDSVSPPLGGSPFSPGSNAGPEMIVVSRPVMVQLCTAGVGSTRFSRSMARTWKLCGPTSWSSNWCS
jgi:hypothetical protein